MSKPNNVRNPHPRCAHRTTRQAVELSTGAPDGGVRMTTVVYCTAGCGAVLRRNS